MELWIYPNWNSEPIIELAPIQDELDVEYLKLKRSITEECVKLQIFTIRCYLESLWEDDWEIGLVSFPEQVSKMIGQILRELEID